MMTQDLNTYIYLILGLSHMFLVPAFLSLVQIAKKMQDLYPCILQMNIYKALDTHCLLTIHNKYRKALC